MGIEWRNMGSVTSSEYICYYCSKYVGAHQGFQDRNGRFKIMICPYTACNKPTFFDGNSQIPSPSFGSKIDDLPTDIDSLYKEARDCTSTSAYTAAVLACRKILMHIAVGKAAKPGQSFAEYVDYLSDKGYVPPGSKDWIDLIRTKGNEANHEIVIMSKEDAEQLIIFLEMLLKLIYEFPGKVKSKAPPKRTNP